MSDKAAVRVLHVPCNTAYVKKITRVGEIEIANVMERAYHRKRQSRSK